MMGGVDWDAKCPNCKTEMNFECLGNEYEYKKIIGKCLNCKTEWTGVRTNE